ncbi:MAG TPA: APC family permease [Bryobacteraceae bacterium]|nr:APC family permease [Bryobacteraceae bacterium]
MSPEERRPITNTAKVVVATTVALSFISFWRGAAIVLSDLASSAYYAGGIAEVAIGPAAPWFVLAVMLFSFAVRSVYMESCSMFVRGGVYIVVKDSMGPMIAKFSVSALVFDYILTGPISVVSAGQYLGHLLDEIAHMMGQSFPFNVDHFAAFFAVVVTGYFWWTNIKGIHESSGKALRIMQITTVMVVAFIIWAPLTILLRGHATLPPAPLPHNLRFSPANPDALGWFKGTFWPSIPVIALIIAFGHSLLSMSGFETLAQVYREIAYPKMRNLRITANIVCWYAVICTGIITVLAGIIITPSDIRNMYADNLLGGLAMRLAGPELLKLLFHIFVVIVGILILSGAVNTAIIGANGVMNRVAEDGVLLDWFRKPHKRFGTTYRIINLIALLQVLTIIASRGDMYLLGEAYAFGVVWSFFLKSLGVLVLRYQRHDQEYKFPFNLHISGLEIPVGLGVTTLILGFVAVANLFTKQIATIYGLAFTGVVFVVFTISEHVNARKRRLQHLEKKPLEEFNLEHQPQVSTGTLHARAGCVLVAVRDYHQMEHLRKVLQKTNLRRHDIVVMTVRTISTGVGEYDLADDQIFSDYERELFSHVVEMAEKEGKPVELLVVPAVNPFDAMVQSAAKLQVSRLVTGVSARMTSEELARKIGLAWESLPEPRHAFSLEIISSDRPSIFVNLGPHPPRLWPEDVDRLHDLWLRLSDTDELGAKLHHRDVVGLALRRLEKDLKGGDSNQVVQDLKNELKKT